jgi:RNA polymerase sigma factor (sigma-70 family)
MSFPQTRVTLIQRLASGKSDQDWRQFLDDYWGPICRFALRWGAHSLDEAEDVAAHTFAVVWENQLLGRWVANRSAKLRSLLCAVVRNVLSNWNRVRANRQRLAAEVVEQLEAASRTRDEQSDAFYAAWAEDLLQQAVESLAAEYYAQGKGDYVRVFYGRLCQRLTIAQVADALEITPAAVDHYFRDARDRLSKTLADVVRRHVERYCPLADTDSEFAVEWQQLGTYLSEHGGLSEAVQQAYDLLDPVQTRKAREAGVTKALTQLTSLMRGPSGTTSAGGNRARMIRHVDDPPRR